METIYNKLTLTGSSESIERIIDDEFCFGNTVPSPGPVEKSWFLHHWGVPEEASVVKINKTRRGRIVTFTTIDSPPDIWLNKTSQIFPEILFDLAWVNETKIKQNNGDDENQIPLSGMITGKMGRLSEKITTNYKMAKNFATQYFPEIYNGHLSIYDYSD